MILSSFIYSTKQIVFPVHSYIQAKIVGKDRKQHNHIKASLVTFWDGSFRHPLVSFEFTYTRP